MWMPKDIIIYSLVLQLHHTCKNILQKQWQSLVHDIYGYIFMLRITDEVSTIFVVYSQCFCGNIASHEQKNIYSLTLKFMMEIFMYVQSYVCSNSGIGQTHLWSGQLLHKLH